MELIFDRTSQDVQRWKDLYKKGWANLTESERAEWMSPMKGAYGVSDMNRVERAVEALSRRLWEMGYLYPLEVKTDWAVTDCPAKADFDRYFGNVAKLRAAVPVFDSTPETPTTRTKLDHRAANDLERILYDIDRITSDLKQTSYYAGDIYLGEV